MTIRTCADIVYQTYKKSTSPAVAQITLSAFEDQQLDGTPQELVYLMDTLESEGQKETLESSFSSKGESYPQFKKYMAELAAN